MQKLFLYNYEIPYKNKVSNACKFSHDKVNSTIIQNQRNIQTILHSFSFILLVLLINNEFNKVFEVAAISTELSNQQFEQENSRKIIMNQPNDEYIVRNCSFTNCVNSAGAGGAFNIDISNGAVVAFFSSLFVGCRSQLGGGGIFASISSGGQIILDNLCEFYQCKTYGNGGGIYIFIDFTIQSSFIIKDAIFQGCQAMNNYFIQYSYSQTGFGGGVFLGVYGDYDPSINHIDLHGMNISNNSADKYGQSLFVVMRDIIEWCQYGTQGEYVKGNYSDTYSNETDLVGIPMDLSTFNSSSLQTIEQQQQPLELWWRILGILKSAKVIVNESNPIGKLIFHLEGQEMTPGYLNIKIFELRDKTQEEIEQQQKEMNYNFNKNNFKSQKDHSLQSQIAPEHKNVNQQQISISSNLKFNQTLHNSENEIIYPPEDGSNIPIKVVTEIRGSLKAQKATFGLNDYEWLNYKQKVYGVLISNDRNIFTGKQGAENASIILDVVEENDKNALSIWIIIIIIIGSIVIFGIGLFSIIFVVYINKQKDKRELANDESHPEPEVITSIPIPLQNNENSISEDDQKKQKKKKYNQYNDIQIREKQKQNQQYMQNENIQIYEQQNQEQFVQENFTEGEKDKERELVESHEENKNQIKNKIRKGKGNKCKNGKQKKKQKNEEQNQQEMQNLENDQKFVQEIDKFEINENDQDKQKQNEQQKEKEQIKERQQYKKQKEELDDKQMKECKKEQQKQKQIELEKQKQKVIDQQKQNEMIKEKDQEIQKLKHELEQVKQQLQEKDNEKSNENSQETIEKPNNQQIIIRSPILMENNIAKQKDEQIFSQIEKEKQKESQIIIRSPTLMENNIVKQKEQQIFSQLEKENQSQEINQIQKDNQRLNKKESFWNRRLRLYKEKLAIEMPILIDDCIVNGQEEEIEKEKEKETK